VLDRNPHLFIYKRELFWLFDLILGVSIIFLWSYKVTALVTRAPPINKKRDKYEISREKMVKVRQKVKKI
jgi:hypothetical protein